MNSENIRIWLAEIALVFLIFLIILNISATAINSYHSWEVHKSLETVRQADVLALNHNYELNKRMDEIVKLSEVISKELTEQHDCFHKSMNQFVNLVMSLQMQDSARGLQYRQNWEENRREGNKTISDR